jgi:hypothetical protein
MILAHFIGKKNWQIDARRRRRGRAVYKEVSARPGTSWAAAIRSSHHQRAGSPGSTRTRSSAGTSTSMISICPQAAAGRGVPAETHAPRSRPRCADVDRPHEEFLDRRQCLAVAQIPPGQQQARDKRGSTRSPGIPSTAAAHAVPGAFEMRCSARRRERQRNPQQSRGRNAVFIEGGRSSVSRQRRHGASGARTAHKFPVRWREVAEPALYTVECRQAGDLRQR